MAVKRIVEHSEQFNLNGSEYMIIDSDENGTKKYKLSNLQTGGGGTGGTSGYDAEIRIFHSSDTGSDFHVDTISGSYSALRALLSQNICPNVLVRVIDHLSTTYSCSNGVAIYDVRDEVSVPYIWFKVYAPNGSYSPQNWPAYGFIWYANDTITLD